MPRKKRTDQINDEEPPRPKRKYTRKKPKDPSFVISESAFRNLPLIEKEQAQKLIERGEWHIKRNLDDDAHDYLIYLVMNDLLKDGSFKKYVEIKLNEYQKTNPESYSRLMQIIKDFLTERNLIGQDLDIFLKAHYETLFNL